MLGFEIILEIILDQSKLHFQRRSDSDYLLVSMRSFIRKSLQRNIIFFFDIHFIIILLLLLLSYSEKYLIAGFGKLYNRKYFVEIIGLQLYEWYF